MCLKQVRVIRTNRPLSQGHCWLRHWNSNERKFTDSKSSVYQIMSSVIYDHEFIYVARDVFRRRCVNNPNDGIINLPRMSSTRFTRSPNLLQNELRRIVNETKMSCTQTLRMNVACTRNILQKTQRSSKLGKLDLGRWIQSWFRNTRNLWWV